MREHPGTKALLDLNRTLRAATQRATVARYFTRVDAHIAEMDRDASLAFLRGELGKWQTRYAWFQTAVFSPEPLITDASAWDYAETIATIATRIARIERQRVAA